MNREQKRRFKVQLKSKGYTDSQINSIIALRERETLSPQIPEGTQVRINVKQIKSRHDYNKNIDFNKQRYHDFIDTHGDEVFTVEYAKGKTDNPTLVCLKEDTTDLKWLFWTGDLEVVKGNV